MTDDTVQRLVDVIAIEVTRAVLAERAQNAAMCRVVAAQRWAVGRGCSGATECAEAIERGEVTP